MVNIFVYLPNGQVIKLLTSWKTHAEAIKELIHKANPEIYVRIDE